MMLTVKSTLDTLKSNGTQWFPDAAEGPRNIGHCVYCAGLCEMATSECQARVWWHAEIERNSNANKR